MFGTCFEVLAINQQKDLFHQFESEGFVPGYLRKQKGSQSSVAVAGAVEAATGSERGRGGGGGLGAGAVGLAVVVTFIGVVGAGTGNRLHVCKQALRVGLLACLLA